MNKSIRLKKVIAYLKGSEIIKTQRDFAEIIDMNKSNLSSALNGKEEYLTDNLFEKIAKTFPELNKIWLLTGEGEMLKKDFTKIGDTLPNLPNTVTAVPEEDYMMVEYIDLSTNAGVLGGGFTDVDLDEKKTRLVPREYDKGSYLVVRVSGDSMDDGTSRSLKDGDEILIRLWQENHQFLPIKSRLFVINTNDGSVVKQILSIDHNEKCVTLHSFNSLFEDYEVHFDDIIQVFTVEKIISSKIKF